MEKKQTPAEGYETAENLFCSEHKTSNDIYRKGIDRIFGNRDYIGSNLWEKEKKNKELHPK